ncbi:hypothetical protein Q7P37_010759 [Cladosporium fusiforme]
MERRAQKGIFGSIKHTLSRKSTANSKAQQPAHPQSANISQPTRRPAGSYNPLHNSLSSDAPPAYTAAPNAAPSTRQAGESSAPIADAHSQSQTPVVAADDAYSFLSTFDTIFLIDDSGSMAGSLWRQTADALMTITPICTTHDADGVDIYFLNEKREYFNVTSAGSVQGIFETVRPGGPTLTGKRLGNIFDKYFKDYTNAKKPINIICITDGEPSDDVEGALIHAAKKLDKLDAPAWQVGVQFFQVGSDPLATKHLKELDDDLADIAKDKDMRDIVDTVPFVGEGGTTLTGNGILKVVLGAVTRRLDRRSKELHR